MSSDGKKIEQKFNDYQTSLVIQHSDLSLKSVSDMIASQAIDISPKYQRRERWTTEKEADLIESFLLNIPIPPIYLAEDEYGTYSVIDGKQRLTAIHNFLTGNLVIKDPKKFKEIMGLTFDQLPGALKNALSIRPYLRVVTLLKQSDNDLKHEVFLRLNQAGVALNSQEIRNVAYRGLFNDLLIDLSSNSIFSKLLKTNDKKSKVYKEMEDVQFILRFFTLREYWNQFPGNMDVAMNSFMKNTYKVKKDQVDEFRRIFEMTITACYQIWGDNAFRKPDGANKVIQGYFDIQMVCLSLLSSKQINILSTKRYAVQDSLINLLATDELFLSSVSEFTSNPGAVQTRISKFKNELIKIVDTENES